LLFNMVIWSLPLIFMMHDFEEILFLRSFLFRNREKLAQMAGKIPLPGNGNLSAEAFAFGVLAEFVLLIAVTVSAELTQYYLVWFGFYAAFTLHLVVHLVQWILFRRYIPAAVTSSIFLPLCLWILLYAMRSLSYQPSTLLAVVFLCSFITIGILLFLNRIMQAFDRLLQRYRGES
jgi:hypothetical protein